MRSKGYAKVKLAIRRHHQGYNAREERAWSAIDLDLEGVHLFTSLSIFISMKVAGSVSTRSRGGIKPFVEFAKDNVESELTSDEDESSKDSGIGFPVPEGSMAWF